jgi:hypothetical protein
MCQQLYKNTDQQCAGKSDWPDSPGFVPLATHLRVKETFKNTGLLRIQMFKIEILTL